MEDQKGLLLTGTRPPSVYGLLKIHDEGSPIRPVVSTSCSPTYQLAKYITKVLQQYIGITNSFAKSSEYFVELFKQHPITDNIIVSFDVESLFNGASVEKTLQLIQ